MNISSLSTGFAILTSIFLSSCSFTSLSAPNVSLEGNDEEATVKKTVKIADFSEIEASQGIKVIFVQGPNKGVADIATTPSAEKYLRVEVKNKTLKAYYSNVGGGLNTKINGPSIIKVSSPQLNEIDLSSAARLNIEGNLKVNGNFEIDLSSAASFEAVNISCNECEADLSSSASTYIGNLIGDLDIETSSASSFSVGNMTGNLDANASSASSIAIKALQSKVIFAQASSAASINLSKIDGGTIKATAASGAKVKLSGKADSLNKNSSSGGNVSHSNLKVIK